MISTVYRKILLSLLLLLVVPFGLAENAREIMEKVDTNARLSNESAFSVFTLSTCKYGIKNKNLKCVESPRIKAVESAKINVGENKKDTKSIAIVLEPSSERGIGMLSYTYDDSDKDNETWLYLSALGKVKRIASGNNEEESEPVSLFGSEITTEDQETGKLDDYTYQLIKEETYKGRAVYIIEKVPTEKRARKSRYSKVISWIDKERYIALKSLRYDKKGNQSKRIQANKVEKVNQAWLARSLTVMNLITSRLTNMELDAVTFGVDIDEAFLTQRSLTDQTFREKHLSALRAQIQ